MKRTPPRRTVAERLLQNVSGIRFELEQMKKTMLEGRGLFTPSDQLLLARSIEKLESESEKLTALLSEENQSDDPFQVAG